MNPMTLRAATSADATAVLAMARAQHREERPEFAFSAERARARFDECLQAGAVIVSTTLDAPVATCALLPEMLPLSDGKWLRVLWCYVRVEHRRMPHMRELLRAARAIGQSAGLPVHVECPGGEALQGKLGLFRRELGDTSGVTFLVRS